MRKTLAVICVAAFVLTAAPAFAELQTVTMDGQIKIRGNWYSGAFVGPGGTALNPGGAVAGSSIPPIGAGLRWPGFFLPVRPIGTPGNTIFSPFAWDEDESSLSFIEQRTRLGVTADFTNEVSAYIELDSYDIWGEDFRSNYITGADGAAASTDDVEIYQAYIEANEMWGYPMRLRIGRQELSLGSEWLVGVNDSNSFFRGLSFDAIRATYGTDMFSVDLFGSKLAENSPIEEDGDVDLYGLYASYLGMQDMTLDAYYLFLRDGRSLNDTNFIFLAEWLEDVFSVDDYDPTALHTIGLRGAGTFGQFDFESELAYQWGDVDQYGFAYKPFGTYGDNKLEHDDWAANLEVGYTFDMQYQPRVFLGGAYFGGEDNRDVTFLEWLNPFDRPEGSTSFNRLFSNWEYSEFLDDNAQLSNAWVARGGVSTQATESVEVLLTVSYFDTVENFDAPVHFNLGRYRVPVAPAFSFWTTENSGELGWETNLSAVYNYSEDLSFEVGWAHLFVGDGLKEGNFNNAFGQGFTGGTSDDDADHVYVETKIAF